MKCKVVVFSWTGNAAACAVALQNALECEAFLLVEEKERAGNKGFAIGGLQSSLGLKTALKEVPDLSDIDTLILGMPLWAGGPPPAINTFLSSAELSGKTVYAFVTQMSDGVPTRLEKKLKIAVAAKGGSFKHMFVVSVPKGRQMSVEAASPRTEKWVERIRTGE